MSTPVSTEDIRRAKRAGRLMASRGLPATTCPYPIGGNGREQALARFWLTAYLEHSTDTAPVDYGE